MNRIAPAFLFSLALHLAIVALAFVSLSQSIQDTELLSSVPVEIITEMPSFEQAAAPVDELAVKPPEPIPAPEEPIPPQPKPPEPVTPTPQPKVQKEQAKTPPKQPTKPVAKEGTQKPQPKKQEPDLLDNIVANTPSRAQTRRPAQANTRATDGASNKGSAPQDAGLALNDLTARLQRLWRPNCDVPGASAVKPRMRFTLSPNGRVVRGPDWLNRTNDPLWEAGALRAQAAIKAGEPYAGLPDDLYGQPLTINFDASQACR